MITVKGKTEVVHAIKDNLSVIKLGMAIIKEKSDDKRYKDTSEIISRVDNAISDLSSNLQKLD